MCKPHLTTILKYSWCAVCQAAAVTAGPMHQYLLLTAAVPRAAEALGTSLLSRRGSAQPPPHGQTSPGRGCPQGGQVHGRERDGEGVCVCWGCTPTGLLWMNRLCLWGREGSVAHIPAASLCLEASLDKRQTGSLPTSRDADPLPGRVQAQPRPPSCWTRAGSRGTRTLGD